MSDFEQCLYYDITLKDSKIKHLRDFFKWLSVSVRIL